MKPYLLTTCFLFLAISTYAQKLDSIEYEYGAIYFHEYGNSNAKPIIILTGGPGNDYKQLEEMAIKLSQNYWSILIEQRGTGRSIPNVFDSTTINIKLLSDDIKLIMNHLGLKQSTVLGHSWGAVLAMNFAFTYPSLVDELILIGPGMYNDVAKNSGIFGSNLENSFSFDDLIRLRQLDSLLRKNNSDTASLKEVKTIFRSAYVFINPLPDTLYQKIEVAKNDLTANILWKEMAKNLDLTEKLKSYNRQIYVISGRQDPLAFIAYELKINKPSINLNWIERCGHFPMYEMPQEFYNILFKILD